MARTAPVPNMPPIPGMCPSVAVLGGGADGGGAGGDGAGAGDGGAGAGAGRGGDGAGADQRCAPDYERYPECGYASHPVDVVTGRAFTHPIIDLYLPGPLPLEIKRMYSSTAAERDFGLGHGWAHSLGWEIEVRRSGVVVWNEQGVAVDFPVIETGREVIGPWGWLLRREVGGFRLDADDGVQRVFAAGDDAGKRWLLTSIEDRRGNRIAITRQGRRIVEVQDSAGRLVRFAATREGRIASIQVKNATTQGRWVAFAAYGYGERGDLTSATDADGYTSRYDYDERHRLTGDTDRVGLTFHFVYDLRGRCVESWGEYAGRRDPSLADGLPKRLADGVTRAKGIHHCKFDYYDGGYVEVADSREVRRFFGNRHGLLDKRVEGGGVVTATYDERGHIVARTDELGATTWYERDERGRLLREADPLDRTTLIERDAEGLPVRLVDAAGGETTLVRDRWGSVVTHIDPTGGTTTFLHDDRGLVTEWVSPTGGRIRTVHDAHGNVVAVIQANGGVWRWTYDALGRHLSETDPLGATTRFAWSDRGDLIAVYHPDGGVTRYEIDGERRLTRVTDPGGRSIRLTWGGYHKLVAKTDGAGGVVRLRYNFEGELVEVHNERGEIHRREYSPGGNLIGETTFDGRRLAYAYDLAGRLIRVESGARERTELVYNAAGELTERRLHDGSVEIFEYDLLGELARVSWAGGELLFERDAAGRVVRETQVIGAERHEVEVTLDAGGHRIRRATSLDHTEEIERDTNGARRQTVLDGCHAISHTMDLLGREIVATLGGGGRIETAYDAGGRVARRWSTSPSTHRPVRAGEPEWLHGQPDRIGVDKRYRYDPSRELIEAWDRHRGTRSFAYDSAGRLIEAAEERGARWRFAYDAASNVHEAEPGAEAREYGPGGRLLRKGKTRYRWDESGRLIEKRTPHDDGGEEVWRYAWSAADELTSVERPDGSRVELVYDPLGRRVEKKTLNAGARGLLAAPSEVTRFVWDGDVLVHEIRRRAAAQEDPTVEERTYCFEDASFMPWAQRDGRLDSLGGSERAWLYYVNDPIGTPEELITGEGDVACRLQRAPWGATEAEPGGRTGTSLRFQGQHDDPEIGLFYNRFRYYDPDAGRYISPDPVGLEGGIHSFAYGINPLRWIDPLGLAANTPNTGIIYLRRDKYGNEYVGRSKSKEAFERRQAAHKNCNPSAGYTFSVLQGGLGSPDLVQAEEDWIRAGGGPGGRGGRGRLQNRIHAQAAGRYKGKVPYP